jgi:hypothetical protein
MRQILGGSPDATEANPDIAARQFEASAQMLPLFELMKRDQDEGQGNGHWRTHLELTWQRVTNFPDYPRSTSAPTHTRRSPTEANSTIPSF